MPASDDRTVQMTAIIRQARGMATSMSEKKLPLDLFFQTGAAGSRIVALGLAQGTPSTEYLSMALEGIQRSLPSAASISHR